MVIKAGETAHNTRTVHPRAFRAASSPLSCRTFEVPRCLDLPGVERHWPAPIVPIPRRSTKTDERLVRNYLRVCTYSAIAFACSSVSPEIPLLCGGLLCGSPLVTCSTILLVSHEVPLSDGALTAGLPSPFAPWQPAHFAL